MYERKGKGEKKRKLKTGQKKKEGGGNEKKFVMKTEDKGKEESRKENRERGIASYERRENR